MLYSVIVDLSLGYYMCPKDRKMPVLLSPLLEKDGRKCNVYRKGRIYKCNCVAMASMFKSDCVWPAKILEAGEL